MLWKRRCNTAQRQILVKLAVLKVSPHQVMAQLLPLNTLEWGIESMKCTIYAAFDLPSLLRNQPPPLLLSVSFLRSCNILLIALPICLALPCRGSEGPGAGALPSLFFSFLTIYLVYFSKLQYAVCLCVFQEESSTMNATLENSAPYWTNLVISPGNSFYTPFIFFLY